MTPQPTSTSDSEQIWKTQHKLAIQAAEAAWEYSRAHVPGRSIAADSEITFQWVSGFTYLKCDVGASFEPISYTFFAVDKGLDSDVRANRMPLEYQGLRGKYLYLSIPKETSASFARKHHSLRIFETDSQEQMARLWADALAGIEHGERAADLWSSNALELDLCSPQHSSGASTMNTNQQLALEAMTSPGGCFIWGPPGTGKTTVIAAAINDALDNDRSVLLTAHTHVAVDNALMSLMRTDPDLFEPGVIVRKQPSDSAKLTPEARDHGALTDEKAAALIVNKEIRLASINTRLDINKTHSDRDKEQAMRDQIHRMDVDDKAIRQLDKRRGAYEQLVKLTAQRDKLQSELKKCEQSLQEYLNQSAPFADLDHRTKETNHSFAKAQQQLNELFDQKRRIMEELEEVRSSIRTTDIRIAHLTRHSPFPWVRSSREREIFMLRSRTATLSQSEASLERHLHQISESETTTQQQLQTAQRQLSDLQNLHIQKDRLMAKVQESRAQQARLQQSLQELDASRNPLLKGLGNPETFRRHLQKAEEQGWFDLLREWDRLVERVIELDKERKRIETEKSKLEDEYKQTRRMLLAKAPVIATTLDSLVFSPELLARRFDVVIIDEVAGAEAPKVFFAASKADETCALVGDFLQNAPVADAEDPTNAHEEITAAWQTKDIFELAGITDRGSAETHPRCVALRRQYRFPPIIADTVNAFCYDGLLESEQKVTGETVIHFYDTSHRSDIQFRSINKSWRCDATIALAMGILAEIECGSVGFVTPYSPQAILAHRLFQQHNLDVPCGTAHRFQGREFDTVIVDLMQDNQRRWVSRADIHGDDLSKSAAKLLNVALTRAKRRLYLIGNWQFICTQDEPGLKALAQLQHNPSFKLVRA